MAGVPKKHGKCLTQNIRVEGVEVEGARLAITVYVLSWKPSVKLRPAPAPSLVHPMTRGVCTKAMVPTIALKCSVRRRASGWSSCSSSAPESPGVITSPRGFCLPPPAPFLRSPACIPPHGMSYGVRVHAAHEAAGAAAREDARAVASRPGPHLAAATTRQP